MGTVHTEKEEEISVKQLNYHATCTSGHISMMLKIFNMGESVHNRQRLRESLLGHINPAKLKIMVKDHKTNNAPEEAPERENGKYSIIR